MCTRLGSNPSIVRLENELVTYTDITYLLTRRLYSLDLYTY
jgi:hypothetical protein